MSAVSNDDNRQHVTAAIDRVLAGPSRIAAPDFVRRLRQEHQVDAVPRVVTVDGVRLLRGFVFRFQGQSYTARSHARGEAAATALGDSYALRQLRRRGLVFNADEHYSDLAAASDAIQSSAAVTSAQTETISDPGAESAQPEDNSQEAGIESQVPCATPFSPVEPGESEPVPIESLESISGIEVCRQAARKVMDALREAVAGDPVSIPAFVAHLRERGITVEADIREDDVVGLAYLVDGVRVTPTLRGQRSLLVPRADMGGRFTLPELSKRGLVLDRIRDVPFLRALRDDVTDLETQRPRVAAIIAAEAIAVMLKRRTSLHSLTAFAAGLKSEGVELRGAFRDGALVDLGYAVGGFVTGPRFEELDASLAALRRAGLTIDPVRDQASLRALLDQAALRVPDVKVDIPGPAAAADLSSAQGEGVPPSPLGPEPSVALLKTDVISGESASMTQNPPDSEDATSSSDAASSDMGPVTGAAIPGQVRPWDIVPPVGMLDEPDPPASDDLRHDDDASVFGAPPPEWDAGLAQTVEAALAEACNPQTGRLSLIRGVMALRRAGFHVLPRLSPRGDLESLRCTRDGMILHISDERSAFPLDRLRRIGLQDRVPQESIVPVLRSAFQPLDDAAAHPRQGALHHGAAMSGSIVELDRTMRLPPGRLSPPASVPASPASLAAFSPLPIIDSPVPTVTCIPTSHATPVIVEADWFDPMIERACRSACQAYGHDPDQAIPVAGTAWGVLRPAWHAYRPGMLAVFTRVGISPEYAARIPELIGAAYARGFAEGQQTARSRS